MTTRDLFFDRIVKALLLMGFAALPVVLSACGGPPPVARMGVTIADEDAVGFGPKDTTYVDNSYRLGPGDQIVMNFMFDRTLDANITVRPDGGINLPILGDIIVAGKTPGQLSSQIAEGYSRYYTNPQLSINLLRFAPPQAYVLGEVNSPKAIEVRPGMTVLGAIAMAGGQTELANIGSTVLVRRAGANKAVARRFNPIKFANGKNISADLFLQDYDIIYVPRSFVGKVTTAVDLIFDKLASVPVFYLRGWEAFHTDRVYNRQVNPNNSQLGSPETPR